MNSIPALLLLLSGGAACDLPLRWHVGEVDERFGLSREEATDAVRLATLLWEEAADQVFLFQETEDGLPIHFVFDERQASALERRREAQRVEEVRLAAEEGAAGLDELRQEVDRVRTSYDRRLQLLDDRVARHNELVQGWNVRGGAPPEELQRLRIAEEEIDAERRALELDAVALNLLVERLSEETRRANEGIAAYNRLVGSFDASAPTEGYEPSVYLESSRRMGPFTLSTERRIEVYLFESRDHLVQALAHAIGHALGLQHVEGPGSLMSASAFDRPPPGSGGIPEEDAARMKALCQLP